MAIDLRSVTNNPGKTGTTKTASVQTAGKPKGSSRSEHAPADSVKISLTSFSIQQAEQALASVPIVNANHVAEVSYALNNGDYEINAEQVAEKIIELEQQLPE